MKTGKGQGEMIEYILTFLISTTVIIIIYFIIVNIYKTQTEKEIEDQLRQLETQTLNSIIKLYTTGSSYAGRIQNNNAILLGTVDLDYPERVARKSYEIILISPSQIYSAINVSENITNIGGQEFSGAKIIGRTTQSPFVEVALDFPNIDVVAQGSVSNGLNSQLSFYKANISGTVKNIITLGNVSLIASITSVG